MTRQGDNQLPNLETNLIYLFPDMKKVYLSRLNWLWFGKRGLIRWIPCEGPDPRAGPQAAEMRMTDSCLEVISEFRRGQASQGT